MERLADRYELGDPLGQGRSTVFRAVDVRLRREVAIKRVELLAGHEDAEQVRARALREAQAAARLNNPSAVTVYDVVEESGAIWLVMELVEGPSLAQVVADGGPLTHARAASIGLGVLTALEAAHLAGVVHRDVKPANVLVPGGERVKLTDFGVATIRDESRVTASGLIVGSPSYMAPEQATGGEITPATDLWALGALLYFAVEGEPPFQAPSAIATATAVVHGEPRRPENPGPLSDLIARLLTKDPAGRATAGEVRAALSRVARGGRTRVSGTARAPGPGRAPAAAGAGAAADVVAAPPAADDTAVQARPATSAPAEAPPRSPDPVRSRRRVAVAALAATALALVVAAAVAVPALTGGDEPRSAGQETPSTTVEPAAASGASTTAVPTPTTTTVDAPTALPSGWQPYRDPSGAYTIGLPPGWRVEPTNSPNRVDLVDPGTGSFLRIEWTGSPKPDPVQAWRDLAAGFASRNANYEEIGIGPATYRDYDAALWEFRHGRDETLHTGNLGFVTSGRGYALMLRTPERLWAGSQTLFDQFMQAFQPA